MLWRFYLENVQILREKVLIEALQVGAFQKLLLVLHVGCSDETKENQLSSLIDESL